MDEQNTKTFKYGYSLGWEITTAILIVFLVSGLLPFTLAFIHPFLSLFLVYFQLGLLIAAIIFFSRAAIQFRRRRANLIPPQSTTRVWILILLPIVFLIGFFMPPRWWTTQTWGLWTHYKLTANLDEIRQWAGTVQIPQGQHYAEYLWFKKNMSFIAKKYHPMYAYVSDTNEDGKIYRIASFSWGGGFAGHWGLTVGPPDMPIPEKQNDPYHRQEIIKLAPGAYVSFDE